MLGEFLIAFLLFQSTLPREERPFFLLLVSHAFLISIHAPTRGATLPYMHYITLYDRFQSTLPREERRKLPLINVYKCYFNPRSHERSDEKNIDRLVPQKGFQSTLPREERPDLISAVMISFRLFQSTLPREERRHSYRGGWCYLKFQSTLPREERRLPDRKIRVGVYFNPRSHERSDMLIWSIFAG